MSWRAVELPSGKAECRHESECYRTDVVLYESEDSGKVRDFCREHNEAAARAAAEFDRMQRGLFEEGM